MLGREPLDTPLRETYPQYELPARQTEAFRAVLKRVLRADQVRQQARLLDVERVWREAVGEALADEAYIRGLRGGTLHIGVTSSSLLGELKGFREQELLTALQRALPARAIRTLRFTVQPRTRPHDGPPESRPAGRE